MNISPKFSIVFPVGSLVVAFSLFGLLVIGYSFSQRPKSSASAKVYYPAATPVVSNTEPQKINQVSVLSAFAEMLTKTDSSDVPFVPISTPTPTTQALPYFYTELTTKGLIANVTDNSFSVIWLTDAPQPTILRLGSLQNQLSRTIIDDYNGNTNNYFHFSTAKNLNPENTYYYTGPSPITSSFTLPKVLTNTPAKRLISGTIANALPKSECLVFLHAAKSNSSSMTLATLYKQGTWQIPLENLRNDDYSAYFDLLPTDNVTIEAFCIAQNKALYAGNTSSTLVNALQKPILLSVTKIAN